MNPIFPGIVFAGLLAGCAAKVPQELIQARYASEQSRGGLAETLVPAELHKANDALKVAETAFEKDPRGYGTADLAYVAQRKYQLADALAAGKSQVARAEEADAQLQADQDTVMRATQADLATTKSDLATTQTDLATTQTDLASSEAARVSAEAKMNEAMAALAKLGEVKEEPRGVVITLSGGVLFTSEQATLLPEAQTRLADVTRALLAATDRRILIEGHTDSQGTDEYNLDLSQRRANTVRDFMGGHGYDVSHTRAVGIGEARPVASNDTDEGRANNRRVEVIIERSPSATK